MTDRVRSSVREGPSVANLVYKRVSTDQQSTSRQNLVLDEAGIEDPVVFEEDPGTSSRLHPLQRPKFRELLTYARPGDTVHISEMFRLLHGTGHILDVLDVLHRDQVALRIHDGAFSAMDLTARHPRTGELLSTVKFMVQTLAAAGELQRELTYDGLRVAEAKGSKGGRRPAVAAAKTDIVRTAYLEGRSIAALARDHGVSRGAIRTAVADLLPDHTAIEEDAPAPELPVTLDMPGKVADFLRAADLEPAERAALDQGVTAYGAVRATPFASRPCQRSTANSSPAASRSMAARASPRSRPSARSVASTRTASVPSHRSDHDPSQRQPLYGCSYRRQLHRMRIGDTRPGVRPGTVRKRFDQGRCGTTVAVFSAVICKSHSIERLNCEDAPDRI
ncbi:recombinase family protein [Streptomyces sp. NBC_01363]|uniref:recombinase family protein n=1 Tax=Streptomyces sp. NBC_01363 TaxID=2903840 RepID=UPI00224DFD8D|nr:recombinase family protein [Streptomyces sp. NBC_01363]MCX4734429.1 recombinase family protein [Streptomyces sp. NBC_01363]